MLGVRPLGLLACAALLATATVLAQTKPKPAPKPAPAAAAKRAPGKGAPRATASGTPASSAAPPASASPEPRPPAGAREAPAADAGVQVKEADGGAKTFRFTETDIEGRLKAPQLVYFLRRVRAEFAAGDLGHRSFLRELSETKREPSF